MIGTTTTNRTKSPFAPNPFVKAMGYPVPELPVDDLTLEIAAMTDQQQVMLLMMLEQVMALCPQGAKP